MQKNCLKGQFEEKKVRKEKKWSDDLQKLPTKLSTTPIYKIQPNPGVGGLKVLIYGHPEWQVLDHVVFLCDVNVRSTVLSLAARVTVTTLIA